jgi:periplasmic copper chaperone A
MPTSSSAEPKSVADNVRVTNRKRVVMTLLALSAAAGFVSPAWAHLEPKPKTVQAGRKVIVSFVAEHGCGDSPTVRLAIKLPIGLDATPVPKTGWKTSVQKGVVTFSGGQIPTHKPGTFSVSFTAPAKPGTSLVFPSIQTCVRGERSWLQPTVLGKPEPNFPAPAVEVVAATTATTATAAPSGTATSKQKKN